MKALSRYMQGINITQVSRCESLISASEGSLFFIFQHEAVIHHAGTRTSRGPWPQRRMVGVGVQMGTLTLLRQVQHWDPSQFKITPPALFHINNTSTTSFPCGFFLSAEFGATLSFIFFFYIPLPFSALLSDAKRCNHAIWSKILYGTSIIEPLVFVVLKYISACTSSSVG